MKKRVLISVKVLFFFSLIIYSCKENSPVESVPNQTELISRSWKLSKALKMPTDSSNPIDVTNEMDFIYLKFLSDGTYNSSAQNGKWEFDPSNEKIIFDKGSSNSYTADIIKLTKDTLCIKMYLFFDEKLSPCELTFIEDKDSGNRSAELNFDTLWKEFDQKYSFFEIKKINWDSLYNVYRQKINSNTTDYELFQILSSLIAELKDGHTDLTTPFGRYAYTDWYTKYPWNFLGQEVISKYLIKDYGTLAGGYLKYGKVENNIGYIYVGPYFKGDINAWSQAIDVIIDSLKNTRGIIVDIRDNGGGNDMLGWTIAGRFTEETVTYSYTRTRNGPKHSDFTNFVPHTIQPLGSKQYIHPVAFLTNRHCFSSAEGTTLMFRSIPQVTVIGDTTGGGSANPITLQLPNGWSFRVSRWIQYTADKKVFEGIGLAPDIPVWITTEDQDAILEKAIEFLSR